MIWGTAGRQHTWLAIGARSFALLSLVMPLILTNNQLLLLALLAIGAIWAAVTAGELLGIPGTLLLVLDAALIGSVAGLSSHSTTAVLGAMAVPPFTAGLSRGLRGVALSLSAELTAYVVIAFNDLDPAQGTAAFTWAVTGLGLGLIAAFVRRTFLQANDPQRAYRDAQALIRELITLSGRSAVTSYGHPGRVEGRWKYYFCRSGGGMVAASAGRGRDLRGFRTLDRRWSDDSQRHANETSRTWFQSAELINC